MPYEIEKLTPTCIVFVWIYIACEIAFIGMTVWEVAVLNDALPVGPMLSPDLSVRDAAVISVAVAFMLVMIATFTLNGIWIYRASSNARAINPDPARISPGWAVGWYAIPFVNLWMPFRAMKQIWNSSIEAGRDINAPVGHPFGIWWACWAVSSVISAASLRLSVRAETTEELSLIGYIDMVGMSFDAVAAVFFIRILREVSQAQADRSAAADVFA